jgi:hypothetical protein
MDAPKVILHGFPTDDETRGLLYWLGDDYSATLARDVARQLAADDPAGRMLSLHCIELPKLVVDAAEDDGRVLGVRAEFPLRVVMRGGDGARWRLSASAHYEATKLDREDGGNIACQLEISQVDPEP